MDQTHILAKGMPRSTERENSFYSSVELLWSCFMDVLFHGCSIPGLSHLVFFHDVLLFLDQVIWCCFMDVLLYNCISWIRVILVFSINSSEKHIFQICLLRAITYSIR